MLPPPFFDRDARVVARDLLGCVLRRRHGALWLSARIIETEAYLHEERGSHASLGRTPSREALFMRPGTIYMYFSRAGDSFNVSCRGPGNAVLFKSAVPHLDARSGRESLERMAKLNPRRDGGMRDPDRLCSGQTLLCGSLDLKVRRWTGRSFDSDELYVEDVGWSVPEVVQTRRLGIPEGRDEHLLYRYVDAVEARRCTQNPLSKRAWTEGRDYRMLRAGEPDPEIRGSREPPTPRA